MANEDPGPSSQSSQSFQPASQGHAFLTISSSQSMVGNFTQEALYSQLALLGIPSRNLVRSSLSDESVFNFVSVGFLSTSGFNLAWYEFYRYVQFVVQFSYSSSRIYSTKLSNSKFI